MSTTPPDRPTEPLRPRGPVPPVESRAVPPSGVDPNIILLRLEDAVASLRTGLMVVGAIAVVALGIAVYALVSSDDAGTSSGSARRAGQRRARVAARERVDRLSRQVQDLRSGNATPCEHRGDRVDELDKAVESPSDREDPSHVDSGSLRPRRPAVPGRGAASAGALTRPSSRAPGATSLRRASRWSARLTSLSTPMLVVAAGSSFEPLQILPSLAFGALYFVRARTLARAGGRCRAWRQWCFYGGLALIVVALVSPLGSLGDELFCGPHGRAPADRRPRRAAARARPHRPAARAAAARAGPRLAARPRAPGAGARAVGGQPAVLAPRRPARGGGAQRRRSTRSSTCCSSASASTCGWRCSARCPSPRGSATAREARLHRRGAAHDDRRSPTSSSGPARRYYDVYAAGEARTASRRSPTRSSPARS